MWIYEKKLQYPVKICKSDLKMAKLLFEVYGGQDGELSLALQYLNQRYTVPIEYDFVIALLTDIGTEELAHLEIVATLIFQLTKDATPKQFEEAGLGEFFVNHRKALFYTNAVGIPWSATYIQAKNDIIADLTSNIAAEERTRATYQNLIDITDDTNVQDVLKFLREREIIHSLRFKEALAIIQNKTN
ncbi:spore coat protein CotJC [Bacillus mycoides]|uniref:manganese catalase family protein n=1 Tax=Bacillus mycoides TaxID=1405 RepID=UPI001E5261E1|nr:manganese catalase family protein [Bacillus mycoides]MCD4642474.1 spore coat protein CotJC [Bacillus mycoides]